MQKKPVRRIFLSEFKAICRAISEYEDFIVLISHLAESFSRSFEIKGCSIMLFDEREKQLFLVSSYGISDEYLKKGPIFVDEKYSSFVQGELIFVEDMQNDPRMQYPEAAAREGIVSMLSIPIKSRNMVIGLIRIYNSEPWAIHEEDVDAFRVLAKQLGLVIEYHGLKNFLETVNTAMDKLPLRMLERP